MNKVLAILFLSLWGTVVRGAGDLRDKIVVYEYTEEDEYNEYEECIPEENGDHYSWKLGVPDNRIETEVIILEQE